MVTIDQLQSKSCSLVGTPTEISDFRECYITFPDDGGIPDSWECPSSHPIGRSKPKGWSSLCVGTRIQIVPASYTGWSPFGALLHSMPFFSSPMPSPPPLRLVGWVGGRLLRTRQARSTQQCFQPASVPCHSKVPEARRPRARLRGCSSRFGAPGPCLSEVAAGKGGCGFPPRSPQR